MVKHPYQNSASANEWFRFGQGDWGLVNLALILLTVVLFLGYLAVNNRTTTDGFTIRTLEKRVVELEEQKRQLDLQVLDRQAMDTVEARALELGFVPISQVDYAVLGAGAVARR